MTNLTQIAKSLRSILFMLLAAFLLTGCIRSEASIEFVDQHHGTLTQHIVLGQSLVNFGDRTAQDWLTTLEQRTHRMGGTVRRPSERELDLTLRFHNAADLEQKFNTLLSSVPSQSSTPLPEIPSHLHMTQRNFWVMERDRLTYDLDLRPLGLSSPQGNILVSPSSLITLDFSVQTPWGGQGFKTTTTQASAEQQQGKRLQWMLTPGDINHLEAEFWVPSPLGIGTLAIATLVTLGMILRPLLVPQSQSR